MLQSSSRYRPRRAALVRRLAVLSATSSIFFAAPAQADGTWLPGAGVFVGAAFGRRIAFQWGLEAFSTYRFQGDECANERLRAGMGPMAQFAMINLDRARVTVGLQGGGELSRNGGEALSGELGATYYFGEGPGFDIHTGANLILFLFPMSARAQWLQGEYAANFGARLAFENSMGPAFTYGNPSTCMVGRPLRTPRGVACFGTSAQLPARADDDAIAAGLEWQRAAQYECASVSAFLQLAAELLAHDAPDALVERALTATQDEMLHAQISADLASRLCGACIWPLLPDISPRAPLPGPAGLNRLATESWLDGCLAEGMAAERARRASRIAVDRGASAAQRRIAFDEARHAELGWSILRWATRAGGDDTRDAVYTLRNVEMDAVREGDSGIAHYGCLGASVINEVTERHAEESRRRLDVLL